MRELLQQALDALEDAVGLHVRWDDAHAETITALREALAAPMPEPVAFVDGDEAHRKIIWSKCVASFDYEIGAPLYAAPPAAPAPVVRETIIDEMDAVASKYAHKLALDLECVLNDYHGKWWDTAMQTIGEYRMAMNRIHERESPTHMGEPVLSKRGITGGSNEI